MPKTSPITGLPIEDYKIPKSPLWRRLNWKRIIPLGLVVFFLGKFFLTNTGFTEEGRVLQVVDQTAEAVEEKNREKLSAALSEDYSDRTGLDKSGLLDLAQGYFNSRNQIEVIRVSSDVDFPSEDRAIGTIRFQVIGNIGGDLYHGFRDSSALGEKIIYRLQKVGGDWKIVSIDPERGTWR
ncbi:MAG: hypothetical protein KC978_08305 [Candidatus Omnitrophica bacterium]|nr:hypothetical protein [Candidatus Omnitrophota bacterium]